MVTLGKNQVCIIILNFNKSNITIDCIKSIKKNTVYPNYKLILVDNGSDKKELRKLKRVKGIDLIENKKNFGFSKGNNIGIDYSINKYNPEFIFFLNNDTKVEKNWLMTSVEIAKTSTKIGAVGSRQLNFEGKEVISYGNIKLLGARYYYGKRPKKVNWLSGAALLVKTKVLRELKKMHGFYFDEIYSPAYYEETDLERRMIKLGYKLIANPNSIVFHKGGATSESFKSDDILEIFLKNRKEFFRRHFNRLYFLPRLIGDVRKYYKIKKLHLMVKAYLGE